MVKYVKPRPLTRREMRDLQRMNRQAALTNETPTAQEHNVSTKATSFPSSSSLSSSNSISSMHSRRKHCTRTSRRHVAPKERLLPRSFKRGGRNKPIIVYDLVEDHNQDHVVLEEPPRPHTLHHQLDDSQDPNCNDYKERIRSVAAQHAKLKRKLIRVQRRELLGEVSSSSEDDDFWPSKTTAREKRRTRLMKQVLQQKISLDHLTAMSTASVHSVGFSENLDLVDSASAGDVRLSATKSSNPPTVTSQNKDEENKLTGTNTFDTSPVHRVVGPSGPSQPAFGEIAGKKIRRTRKKKPSHHRGPSEFQDKSKDVPSLLNLEKQEKITMFVEVSKNVLSICPSKPMKKARTDAKSSQASRLQSKDVPNSTHVDREDTVKQEHLLLRVDHISTATRTRAIWSKSHAQASGESARKAEPIVILGIANVAPLSFKKKNPGTTRATVPCEESPNPRSSLRTSPTTVSEENMPSNASTSLLQQGHLMETEPLASDMGERPSTSRSTANADVTTFGNTNSVDSPNPELWLYRRNSSTVPSLTPSSSLKASLVGIHSLLQPQFTASIEENLVKLAREHCRSEQSAAAVVAQLFENRPCTLQEHSLVAGDEKVRCKKWTRFSSWSRRSPRSVNNEAISDDVEMQLVDGVVGSECPEILVKRRQQSALMRTIFIFTQTMTRLFLQPWRLALKAFESIRPVNM
ncbi:hypothetical protein ABKN59_001933 [Abortiporus biennis]